MVLPSATDLGEAETSKESSDGGLPSPSNATIHTTGVITVPVTTFHIIRHGQALHNIDRAYSLPDPPLTATGVEQTRALQSHLATVVKLKPSAIVTSPMTRTIQTALELFPSELGGPNAIHLRIWPDLREAHDAICNQGQSRAIMESTFPGLDFSRCADEWDYEKHTVHGAKERAETVRKELASLPGPDVVVIGHRGFIAFLVETGRRFENCETRSYSLASSDEHRFGIHENGDYYDFGPTLFTQI